MLLTLYTIVVVLVLFGATIFFHELGHFLVARWCGMVIDTFSVGFGPAIWKRKRGSITYRIGIIPFGGYVALPQMDPSSGKLMDASRQLPLAAPWKKILVSLAGVTGNVVFAVFLAYLVFWFGKPSSPHERNCMVGFVETNSAMYAQGLRIGDEIEAVNNEPVHNWDELTVAVLSPQAVVRFKSPQGEKTATVQTEKNWMGVSGIPGIGWVNFCGVASVIPGSSAEKAGIVSRDVILEFNGVRLYSREHLIDLVNQARDQVVKAKVRRGDQVLEVTVQPKFDSTTGRALIGVMFNTMDVDYDQIVHPRPSAQLREHATAIFRFLRALMTPKEAKAAQQAVGGPIIILLMFWWTVQQSLILAIWFTGFLNVNLAVLNLLPIPILDGGHVVFALWEMITRRPVSVRLVNALMNFFAVLLIGLAVLISCRDVVRYGFTIFSRFARSPAGQTTNAPAAKPAP